MANFFKGWFSRREDDDAPAGPSGGSGGGSEPPPPEGPGSGDGGPPGRSGAPTHQSLENITRGLQHAAAAANQVVAHQYMRLLDQFFDVQDDGSMVAKTVVMVLDEGHRLDVPLITMMTPRGMALDRMKVLLTLRGDAAQAVQGGHRLDNVAADESLFKVSLAPHSGKQRDARHLDIEMEFVALEPPEAIMRLIDEYTNRILPQKPAAPIDEGAQT